MNRSIKNIITAKPTVEGAGVRLRRAFGYPELTLFDPFLLFDDFRSDDPKDYIQGFPWHPHRGIETITYVLKGTVEHGDSLGNAGVIGSGDVQWMTAGSGIIHQEMPKSSSDGANWGFQLWTNLPKSDKMINPRYRDIHGSQMPELIRDNGIKIKIISGCVDGVKGPVDDIVTDPEYLDVNIPPKAEFIHRVQRGYTVFAYVIEGEGYFGDSGEPVGDAHIILFGEGEDILVNTGDRTARFLLISGKPINEPVAWYGPIVMNTESELRQAFEEYRKGTFIKHSAI